MPEKTCSICQCNKVCDHNKYGFENCGNYISADVVQRAEVAKAKRTGATEALGILYKELVDYHENIKSEYMELPQKSTNTARFRGASSTVEHICHMILKLKKKYTEDET